jgi:hypothetical protein
MKNRLPKYWVVQCNTFNPNWMKVIDYLYEIHGERWCGDVIGNYYGYDGSMSYRGTNTYNDLSRFSNNPTLLTIDEFMELTSQKQENMELNELPQYWVVKCDTNHPNWMKVIDYLEETHGEPWGGRNHGDYYGYDGGSSFSGTNYNTDLSYFQNNPTLLTIDEFIKLTNKKENMNKVNKSDLGKIHNVACSTWKSKLETYTQRNPFGDSIELSDSEIDEMFDAATTSQIPVLVSILGERRETIDFNRIKTGSKVMITRSGHHCNGISGINLNEPVDVVFYNTPHLICSDGKFSKDGMHGSYVTFNQNGKFVLFSSDTRVDYITKVIKY